MLSSSFTYTDSGKRWHWNAGQLNPGSIQECSRINHDVKYKALELWRNTMRSGARGHGVNRIDTSYGHRIICNTQFLLGSIFAYLTYAVFCWRRVHRSLHPEDFAIGLRTRNEKHIHECYRYHRIIHTSNPIQEPRGRPPWISDLATYLNQDPSYTVGRMIAKTTSMMSVPGCTRPSSDLDKSHLLIPPLPQSLSMEWNISVYLEIY